MGESERNKLAMKISTRIFKAYDIRGIYGEEINPESVEVITKACACIFKSGAIIVGYDGRRGSNLLAEVICKTIEQTEGFEVTMIGLCTTPMFYFAVNKAGASGGMMVTASHNPKEYSGIKIVGPEAYPVSGYDVKKQLADTELI